MNEITTPLRLEQFIPATPHPEKDWVLTDGADLLLGPMSSPGRLYFLAEDVGGDMAVELMARADLTALVQDGKVATRRPVNEQGLRDLNEAVERAKSSADHVGALYVAVGVVALADKTDSFEMKHTWRIATLHSVQRGAEAYAPIIQGHDGALGLIPRRMVQEVQLRHNMPKLSSHH